MAGRFKLEAVFAAVDKMTAPIAKMQSRMDRFAKGAEKGIKDLDKAADRWLSGMKKFGLGAAAAATATGFALAAASKPGMAFEQQMADLGATSLKTRDQIQALEAEAKRLGAATKFSATEVGAAMEQMAKAGFEEQDILEGIGGMIYASAAAGEDLAATTENVSSVLKGMGLATKDASRVADVLALASVRTNSSISSLGESMSKVSSTARQLGVPLEDTVAMVAMLQDVGLDASEAGSSVATMLTMMSKPSDAVAAKMKKMGVSFKDAAGNMLSPTEVLGQLVKAGEKAGGNMSQVAFFADLVGMRGQKAAVNLKDLFAAGKVTALTDELRAASGTAEKMANLRMNTLTGDLDVLLENIKTIAIDLFSLQSGPLRDLVKGMKDWVEANGALITSGITDFLNGIADNFEQIVTWGRRIATVIAVITTAALAVKAWAGAVWLLNAAIAANPISLIAIAVVGAIALILAFWPEISAFFSDMWDGMLDLASSIASAVASFVSAAFEPIKDFFVAWFEFVTGIWTLVAMGLVAILRPGFDVIIGIARSAYDMMLAIWTPVLAFYGMIWDGIVAAAQVSWELIAGVITGYVSVVTTAWSAIGEFFAGIWEGIKSSFLSVLGPVWEKITWAVEKVRGLGRDTLGTDEEAPAGTAASGSQVVSPQERVARSITETSSTQKSELTIKDKTGTAELTKKPRGGAAVRLQPSGAF